LRVWQADFIQPHCCRPHVDVMADELLADEVLDIVAEARDALVKACGLCSYGFVARSCCCRCLLRVVLCDCHAVLRSTGRTLRPTT